MVRPERRVLLAGARPVRVSAGAPGSRPQPKAEMPPARAGRRKPLKETGARKRAATVGERCSHVIVSAERCLKGLSRSYCQLRLKIPQSSGRKFPSPRQVVVYRSSWRMVHKIQPVKRRRALLESNPPRNNRLQTHQDDGARGEARDGFALGFKERPHRIDRFAHALKTQTFPLPRLFGAPARGSSGCACGNGIRPALRRSLSR